MTYALTDHGILVKETDPAAAVIVNPRDWTYAHARRYGYPLRYLRADIASYEMGERLDEEWGRWQRGYLNGLEQVRREAKTRRRAARRALRAAFTAWLASGGDRRL